MRFDWILLFFSLLRCSISSAIPRHDDPLNFVDNKQQKSLFRRRGGGGSGTRGGGGSRSGSGSGSSGGSRSGSSSSSGSSSGGSRSGSGSSNTAPKSNMGGTSPGGTGPVPSFGGGSFYGGGSRRPYRAGGLSPAGVAPIALVGATALAFWPGSWPHGAYLYPYTYVHHYHNVSSNRNETAKVLCACSQTTECGCDENNNSTYYDELIGNGSYDALNKTLINVGQYRGAKTLLINGTLPNGTTADGPGEGDDATAAASAISINPRSLIEAAAWWPVIAAVLAGVLMG